MIAEPIQNVPSVSVLMAVYHKDHPVHFAEALDSLRPFSRQLDSVIVVADGPLTDKLESVLANRATDLRIDVVRLPASQGLGEALNAGLSHSKSDFLLRMDSDDLSRPERLDLLIKHLSEYPYLDVIGSHIAEFEAFPAHTLAVRRVPLTHNGISRLMRIRCAMNHVTCLLRREAVLKVGGYQGGSGFAEDWWLWARLLNNNAKFANIDSVLVDVRVGNGFIERRRGISKVKYDLQLVKMMLSIKFIRLDQAFVLLSSRMMLRFLPSGMLRILYGILRK